MFLCNDFSYLLSYSLRNICAYCMQVASQVKELPLSAALKYAVNIFRS
jgi:hypothetical protein